MLRELFIANNGWNVALKFTLYKLIDGENKVLLLIITINTNL